MKIISNLHTEFYLVRLSSYNRIKYLVILVVLMLGFSIKSYSKNFYFSSSTGNDSYTAIQAQDPNTPWKTIDQLNKSMNLFTAGDFILFKRGDTFYGTITIAKSGTSGSPIVLGAYGTGNDPIITGFITITGWTNESGGIYSKTISCESKDSIIVTVDGVNTAMGRYPNAGIFSLVDSHTGTHAWGEHDAEYATLTDADLDAGVTDWEGAEVVVKTRQFTLESKPITDHTSHTLTFLNMFSELLDDFGYFIQNDIRTLDVLGEWYYDGTKFYMYFGGVDPTTKTVKISTIENGCEINGYDYITVDGLSFQGLGADGFYMMDAAHITIQNCSIAFCNENGIKCDAIGTGDSHSSLIDNNIINEMNDNGIYVGGAYYANEWRDGTITNNTITNCGLVEGATHSCEYLHAYAGITINDLTWTNMNTLIEYNTVENIGYDGIAFMGNNITVRHNFVNRFCITLSDGGGIYVYNHFLEDVTSVGYILNNIVLNGVGNLNGCKIESWTTVTAAGIYVDGYSRGITVDGNTVANNLTSFGYFFNGNDGNRDGVTTNNTFYNNLYGIRFAGANSETKNLQINNNIVFCKDANQYCLFYTNQGGLSYTETIVMDYNYYARPIDDDYIFRNWVIPVEDRYYSLEEWQTYKPLENIHSHKSPTSIADTAVIDFYYNATKVKKSITLNQPMIDVKGTKYANSITLLPFTSVVFMVDPNPAQPVVPIYTSSAVENATASLLEMTYNVRLTNTIPVTTAFTVQVNGVNRNISSVAISGNKVRLTLTIAVVYGGVVTVAYTKPSTNPLQTSSGGEAATLGAQTVTNKVNPASPVFVNSAIENATPSVLEIVYNVNLAGIIPAGSAFTILVNSAARTVNVVSVSGSKVLLTLASPVVYGDNVTISYTKPSINPLQTAAGGQAATIPAQTVTNNVSFINSPPVVVINSPPNNLSGFISQIDATGSYDANNDNLSYTWAVPDNIPVSSTNSSIIQFLSPIVNAPLTVEFTLKISDGKTTQSKVIPVEILPYKPELEVAGVLNVEASGFQSPNYPHNILDGNIGTLWAANGNNQWLILDLKEPFNIQHVKIAFQLGQRRESYFDILGSNDKVTWEAILTKSASCAFSGDIQVFDFPPSKTGKEFKYVKLVGLSNSVDSWNYISEFKIFGYKYRNPTSYEQQPVKVYPNPARELINIRIDETAMRPDFIRIINLSGKVVFQDKVMQDIKEFQIPINLINDAYVVQMGSGNLTLFTQKLIIIN